MSGEENNDNKKPEIIRELSLSVSAEGLAVHVLSSVPSEDFEFLTKQADKLLHQYAPKNSKRTDSRDSEVM